MARAVGREPRTRRRVPRPEEWQTPRETAEAWQGSKGDGLGIPFGCDSDHEEVPGNIRLKEWGPVDGASAYVRSDMGIVS